MPHKLMPCIEPKIFLNGQCVNAGSILGNLRVKISDSWEKIAPGKKFEIFVLKHPKMTTAEEGKRG